MLAAYVASGIRVSLGGIVKSTLEMWHWSLAEKEIFCGGGSGQTWVVQEVSEMGWESESGWDWAQWLQQHW